MKTLALVLTMIFAAGCSGGQTPTQGPDPKASNESASGPGGLVPEGGATTAAATSTGSGAAAVPTTQPTSVTTTAPSSDPVSAAVVPDASRGEKLFAENNCTACHGTKVKPGKKNVFVMKWSDDEKKKAADIIRKGKSPMPGFGDKLSDPQVSDLVAFVSTK